METGRFATVSRPFRDVFARSGRGAAEQSGPRAGGIREAVQHALPCEGMRGLRAPQRLLQRYAADSFIELLLCNMF